MPVACVLINCDVGSEDALVKEIAKLEGVKEVTRVSGVYDVLVKMDASTTEALKQAITWKIRRIPKVRATVTLLLTGTEQ